MTPRTPAPRCAGRPDRQRRICLLLTALPCVLLATPPSLAAAAEDGDGGETEDAATDDSETAEAPDYQTTVHGRRSPAPELPAHRARGEVTREDLERRMPRSAPDALRFEPGVFVQQTAHSQGSAFIRGLTGQQTLILFDGIRLNNSTYRQGPNQYFFTLDSQTIQSLQVVRGGSSTRYGSDALGGVILARPLEPSLRAPGDLALLTWDPHLRLRGGTADREVGGRAQVNATLGESVAFFGGAGARHVGLLEGGGAVRNPADGELPRVPRLKSDGRTQLGTGFEEITADGRLLIQLAPDQVLEVAAYVYRQYDAPRTDQCPAAYAQHDECLLYDEQFRTLAYAAWEGEPGLAPLAGLRVTLSYQQQRERRALSRPPASVENLGRDVVDTFGITVTGTTRRFRPLPWLQLDLDYGVDTYVDLLSSAAWITFTDIDVTERRSRGQYLDGSRYVYGGLFAEGSARLSSWLALRAGGRVSWIAARAEADPDSGSAAVDRLWLPVVGNGGLEVRPLPWLHLLANVDLSFRAPNLDDLTSRQQTGPGFQFENPDLGPERATTFELGVRLVEPLQVEVWLFRMLLAGAVSKSPRPDTDCPPDTPGCQASWTRFMLVNASEDSVVHGVEAAALAELPWGLAARATLAWTWGEGPNPGDPPSDPSLPFDERVPISRIPPLNGTVELLWRHGSGVAASGALRWATRQDRLAVSDVSDARIPLGGTPGFAVLDLRLSYRLPDLLLVSVGLENVLDAAYRYHGSSVNGPGRSLVLVVDVGPLWRW